MSVPNGKTYKSLFCNKWEYCNTSKHVWTISELSIFIVLDLKTVVTKMVLQITEVFLNVRPELYMRNLAPYSAIHYRQVSQYQPSLYAVLRHNHYTYPLILLLIHKIEVMVLLTPCLFLKFDKVEPFG